MGTIFRSLISHNTQRYYIFPMASFSPPSSSSSSSVPNSKYDVFLSFRGEDTRRNFVSHTYHALRRKGLFTFIDYELPRGNEISASLFRAIEESRTSIVILSECYAHSAWSLDELVKIMECMEVKGQTVLPVFYEVDPSDVRNVRGNFKRAFEKYEEIFKDQKEKVARWKAALIKAANLSGWVTTNSRNEAEVVEEIVGNVFNILNQRLPSVSDDFFGIESRLRELNKRVLARTNDVCFIGIWGMGGIGKTTLARALYDRSSDGYEGSCFLENVRENCERKGALHLQKQLLSKILKVNNLNVWDHDEATRLISQRLCHKKVFLVLDDVDKLEQIQALAGMTDWFGCGSVIVITTRDKHLLTSHGVSDANIHKVEELSDEHAVLLLRKKVFKNTEEPPENKVNLLKHVLERTKGLPLAIEVLGSFLCDKTAEEWKSSLDRLRDSPDDDILRILRISYDGLPKFEKKIFLDIACFFNGEDRDRVVDVLEGCGFHPRIGMRVLTDKSLLTISSENKLQMHDLLQEVGREFVRELNPDEPWKWSRLWLWDDACPVLTENMGTEMIEGIMLDTDEQKSMHLNGKTFSSLKKLRVLKLGNVHLSGELVYLSNKLQVLNWDRYPLKCLPLNFQANKLVELKMHNSNMEYLWKGVKRFEILKTIELCHSCSLTESPDFNSVPNLERLNLEGCTKLVKVHISITALKKLIELILRNCENLVCLPSNISGMKSLKIFDLHGCSKLDELPYDFGELESLEVLDVGETAISQWPSSIVKLRKLKELSLSGSRGPLLTGWTSFLWSLLPKKGKREYMSVSLPPFTGFDSLTKLNLSCCNLETLPDSLGSLISLETLNLSRNNFVSLPASLNQLTNLRTLLLRKCERLQSLPNIPLGALTCTIAADDCTLLETICGSSNLFNLELGWCQLSFANCFNLVENKNKTCNWKPLIMLLEIWIQNNLGIGFQIMVPGSVIPTWVSLWNLDDSFLMKLPPHWNNEDLTGLLFCAIIQPQNEELSDDDSNVHVYQGRKEKHYIEFVFTIDTRVRKKVRCDFELANLSSNHLLMGYSALDVFEFKEELWPETYAHLGCRIRSDFGSPSRNVKVIKSGICLVYKEDVENLEVSNNIGRVCDLSECESSEILLSVLNDVSWVSDKLPLQSDDY